MSDYVNYKNIVRSLQGILGLSCIEVWETDDLHPYVVFILEYLNTVLVTKDPGTNLEAIRVLCDTIDAGNKKILVGTPDFTGVLGEIPGTLSSGVLLGIAWSNVCTSLWDTCRCNYAAVLWELEHQTCECACDCTTEIDSTDNLYSKLVGNGAVFPKKEGCGCI